MEVRIIMTVLEVIHKKHQSPGGQNNTTKLIFTAFVQNEIQYTGKMHTETLNASIIIILYLAYSKKY